MWHNLYIHDYSSVIILDTLCKIISSYSTYGCIKIIDKFWILSNLISQPLDQESNVLTFRYRCTSGRLSKTLNSPQSCFTSSSWIQLNHLIFIKMWEGNGEFFAVKVFSFHLKWAIRCKQEQRKKCTNVELLSFHKSTFSYNNSLAAVNVFEIVLTSLYDLCKNHVILKSL